MLRIFVLTLCLIAVPLHAGGAPAQVVVLSTLHQLHAEVPGYSFEDLSHAIEQLAPDVLRRKGSGSFSKLCRPRPPA